MVQQSIAINPLPIQYQSNINPISMIIAAISTVLRAAVTPYNPKGSAAKMKTISMANMFLCVMHVLCFLSTS